MIYEDPAIPLGAKALYGYLKEIADNDGCASISTTDVVAKLGISSVSMCKYRSILSERGYIKASFEKPDGRVIYKYQLKRGG